MNLTPDQIEKFKAFLNSKWKTFNCSRCSANNWNISPQVFQLAQFNKAEFQLGGPVIPAISLTCNNCGNTVLVNAIVAGIVEAPKPEEKKNA